MINQNLLLTGDDGYNLTKSLRFRSSASAYLNRTPASAGNRRTWTYSTWIKRGTVGAEGTLISGGATTGRLCVFFNSSGQLVSDIGGTGTYDQSTAVYRDPSAWYHFVWQFDTTQATAANRSRMYINGVQVSLTNTRTFTQNADYEINNSVLQTLGTFSNSIGTYNFDGYQTEVNFIDGQALTPSSFGSTNALTGVWQPAKYTGTYGTNGFYLPFTNTTSTSTLGNDFSGNSNTWTVNNISLTAGSTYDSMNDVPTLTSATAANYAVLNPLQLPQTAATSTSNGNLQLNGNTGSAYNSFANGTIFITSGKWYAEFQQISGTRVFAGISSFTDISTPNNWNTSSTYYINTGQIEKDGVAQTSGASWTTGDIIGVAYDAGAATCAFYKNNSLQLTVTGIPARTYSFSVNGYTSGVIAANFGQQPFTYTPPTGFVALNTFNLPTSTIVKGSTVMDATLYTGDGTTSKSVVNAAPFKPDLVWVKSRSNAYSNQLFDSVRGTGALSSDGTSSEQAYGNFVSYNSNGFTVSITGSIGTNNSGSTFVGWQWQAGQGSTSSNTNGSITSTVSVNATAGFSVVTYTGTGSNATVGHGLGVAPSMYIVKSRSNGGTYYDWAVYHTGLGGNTQTLWLNLTNSVGTYPSYWNSTSPTSSVFSLGNDITVNQSSATYVAYCWSEIAGFSKFGSYTGNGSSDGSFIYTGFRPKFVMVKCSSNATNWWVYDSSRNTYNEVDLGLLPSLANAETSGYPLDFLSNGFKFRNSNGDFNGSGRTYIYMAFAESPFRNSLAR